MTRTAFTGQRRGSESGTAMNKEPSMKVLHRRAWLFLCLILGAAAVVLLRLFWVQIVEHDRFSAWSLRQTRDMQELYSERDTIYDRGGKPLAFSIMVKSLYADPGMMNIAPEEAARLLAPVIHESEGELLEKMSRDTRFVWLERVMDPDMTEAVKKVLKQYNMKGFGFIEESRRYYPNGGLLANVLGFVGIDGKGLDGLEKSLEDVLSGGVNKKLLLMDARGNPILHSTTASYTGKESREVWLTIDESMQFFAERALDRAMESTHARGGIVIMMDPKTGGILAMVNRPSYDPNHFYRATENEFKNRAVIDIYEPGSTFKPIIAATALDAGTYTEDIVWHDPGKITASGHTIQNWDDESYGDVRLVDILKFSVNTGFAHVGLLTGGDILTEYAKRFGFGKPTGIELPGEGSGILFDPEEMRPIDVATMSIGQGIAVTPLQMVQAYSAIANGGKMVKPHIIDKIRNADGSVYKETMTEISGTPVKEKTADAVRAMMEKEVSEGGGGNARVPGYNMCGKTGTAQKIDPVKGGYLEGQYIASFCGFGPAEDPRVICLVVLDDPQGMYYGGMVAAPVFSEIMSQTMRYMGIHPLEAHPGKETAPPPAEEENGLPPLPERGAEVVTVPDFRGWSMRDVGEWLSGAGLKFRPDGSGFADSQTPPPWSGVPRGTAVDVHFSPE